MPSGSPGKDVPQHIRERAMKRWRRIVDDKARTRAQRRNLYREILRDEIRKEG